MRVEVLALWLAVAKYICFEVRLGLVALVDHVVYEQ
jgi:hypothetical protein